MVAAAVYAVGGLALGAVAWVRARRSRRAREELERLERGGFQGTEMDATGLSMANR